MKEAIRKRLHEKLEEVQAGANRQKVHLMADIGWISDPNGLAVHNGTVHIFHQYTPDAKKGLHKAWGHYTTKDYVHYRDEGTAMVPDAPFDKDGCYSGSALSHNGTLHLFYTGNHLADGDYDYINEGRGHYTCHLTSKDGLHFSKKEVLLKNEDYPKDMSCHVRDPKLSWIDGRLYMVLGARTRDSKGCALLYTCDPLDPTKMTLCQILDSDKPMGYMWECPGLMELDGHPLLMACPQGVQSQGVDFENLHDNGIFRLEKGSDGLWKTGDFQILDRGNDFYAPQTYKDEQGREILIGWMGMPDMPFDAAESKEGWIHCLTLPRELSWKNNQVYQYPVKELEALRQDKKEITLEPGKSETLPGRVFELLIQFDNSNEPFVLELRKDVKLEWDGQLLTLSLKESGKGRTDRHALVDAISSLEIFSDESSLEIFVNHGQECFSTRVYDQNEKLHLSCSKKAEAVLYELKPVEIDYSPAL